MTIPWQPGYQGATVTPPGYGDPHSWTGPAGGPPAYPGWVPSDNGFLAASAAADAVSTSFTMIAGTVYLLKVPLRQGTPLLSAVTFLIGTPGSGASTGSFCGLYTPDGTRVALSADCAAAFTGSGAQTVSFAAATAPAGAPFVWVGMVSNLAVSQPAVRAWGTPTFALPNMSPGGGLPAGLLRVATNGTGQTTLAATLTVASNSSSGATMWVALS